MSDTVDLVPIKSSDIAALRRMLREMRRLFDIAPLDPRISGRIAELMESTMALADDLHEQTPEAFLGSQGGHATTKSAADEIAAIRNTKKAGGRDKA